MKKKAFTLVELLIVIVIIGILATLVTLALSTATNNAKNAKSKNAVATVQKAVIAKIAETADLTGCVNSTDPTVWTTVGATCMSNLGGFSTAPQDAKTQPIKMRGAVDGSTYWISGQTATSSSTAPSCFYVNATSNAGLTTPSGTYANCNAASAPATP